MMLHQDLQRLRLMLFSSVLFLVALLGDAPAAAGETVVLSDFDKRIDFTVLNFGKGAAVVEDGMLRIDSGSSKGGAGVNAKLDLTDMADRVPSVRVRVEPGNQAEKMRVMFVDANKTRQTYDFALPKPGEFVELMPAVAIGIGQATGEGAFDASAIEQFQVQGDWGIKPIKVTVDRITLVEPTPEMKQKAAVELTKQREKAQAKAQAEAELQTERRTMLEKGVAADPNGPRVVHVAAADRNIISLALEVGTLVHGQKSYEPKRGDEIVGDEKKLALVWRDGKIVEEPKNFSLRRDLDGDGKTRRDEGVGAISQPYGSSQKMLVQDYITGTPLTEATADAPEAYTISSTDDPNFAAPAQPKAVHRKSRPLDKGDLGGGWRMEHKIYLVLPHELKPGATYTIRTPGLNLQKQEVAFKHDPTSVRSDSIHASHIGYRPDDPFKLATLSLWLGTGGQHAFDDVQEFHLIEPSGQAVFTGAVKLARKADEAEKLKEEKNYAFTNVYHLDFSSFSTPGEYRVHVPGIGVSYPVRIAREGTWGQAFKTSMHGLLAHRAGITLGAPFTTYERPRNMHPDDVPIFRLVLTRLDGEADAVRRALGEQLGKNHDPSKLRRHEQAWGGYMDAGDFDRRSQHLQPTYRHVELFVLFPAYFEQFKLALPPEEANNAIPDLLDEALFNLAFYRRLQEPDGGVGGGVESTEHPRDGQTSWQESLLLGSFAPDPITSYHYAAVAAKMSGALAKYDPSAAAEWRRSAVKAYDWANQHGDTSIDAIASRNPGKFKAEKARGEARSLSRLAALELYRLTGEPSYHEHVKSGFADTLENAGRQLDMLFAYATLPADKADASLQQQAREAILAQAEIALQFQQGNSFHLTTLAAGIPPMGYLGYWSVPEMTVGPVLPRAYVLTKEQKYLAGAVAAANYSAGANPMNITMTTGVGHAWVSGVLHIDSRVSGQPTPAGITPFGQSDPSLMGGAFDWAHNFHLGKIMTPHSRRWPGHEGYVGMFRWPAMNEYTIHQTIGPTSYYWGFLAARDSASAAPSAAR
jgi:endoglucanase